MIVNWEEVAVCQNEWHLNEVQYVCMCQSESLYVLNSSEYPGTRYRDGYLTEWSELPRRPPRLDGRPRASLDCMGTRQIGGTISVMLRYDTRLTGHQGTERQTDRQTIIVQYGRVAVMMRGGYQWFVAKHTMSSCCVDTSTGFDTIIYDLLRWTWQMVMLDLD